ncbi:MAG: AEC family transporter [Hyphomonadaceae bacterium]|nr:AEC family transporter [Hyphomonadaceae bacterium]
MFSVLTALIPIVLILALGKGLSALNVVSQQGWLGLERITYFVLFPALIIGKLATVDFSALSLGMPVALVGAQLALGAISIALGLLFRQARDRIGVYVQSAVRWNTFIALALAQELMGGEGVALVVIAAAAMIPTANILSVSALLGFSDERIDAAELVKQIAINPLVIACVVGLSLNLLVIPILPSVTTAMDLLAQATIAAGLLTTGAAIEVKRRSASIANLLGWSLLRLLGLSLLAGLFAVWLGVTPTVLMAILIATAVPTASNGTILARQLGADASLAANLIVVQTVLSALTISGVFWFAQTFM